MSHLTVLTSYIPGLESGDTDLSVTGTGTSIPWGVDAVFQYNGLTFNDRSVIDKIRVISIEGIDDADVRDTREDNPADDGETLYGAFYGGRTIVFNGRIEAFQRDKLRDLQLAVRSAFSDINVEYPLYFLTGNTDVDHFINCKKFSKINWAEEQKDSGVFFRDFQLTLRASNPRFLLKTKHFVTLVLDDETQQELPNFGNYWSEPIINIFGPVSNVEFNIESSYTIETFKLKTSVTISLDEMYQIDIANKTVTDADGNNRFADLDPGSDFPKIVGNANFITIPAGKCTGTDANSLIEVIYRDSFI